MRRVSGGVSLEAAVILPPDTQRLVVGEPSVTGVLREIWNAHKYLVCLDKQTGEVWARALSQSPAKYAVIAVSDAVKAACNDGQTNS